MLKGKSANSNPRDRNVSVSFRVNDTFANRRVNSGNVYFPLPISPGRPVMDSQYHDSSDYYGDGMDRPPTVVFPGVVAAPGIGIQNVKKGSSGIPDLAYYPPQTSASLAIESSLSGTFNGNHHRASGSIIGGNGRGAISAAIKPGYCQTLAVGAVNCIALHSTSAQCNFDSDCAGTLFKIRTTHFFQPTLMRIFY